jgi:maleylpyruvate isomerase
MSADELLGQLNPVFLGAVDSLTDAAFAEPTALPGWSRAHVVAHVHSNAEALGRLVHWAQRAAEIESGSRLAPSELRAQGRSIPAEQVAWLRCREVGVHAVDLTAGVTFADLPHEFLAALVQDVVAKRTAGGELPTLAAWLTGRGRPGNLVGAWL